MRDKVLILDLDETLIYGTEQALCQNEDFRVGSYFVYKRPGLEDFLTSSNSLFRIAIWTASSADYAHEIIEKVFPNSIKLDFVFTQERCLFRSNPETGESEIIKPLKKVRRLGFPIEKLIIVDDIPETFQQNYGNAILIRKFSGDKTDKELFLLRYYLEMIANVENIRELDKRNWRRQAIRYSGVHSD